MVGICVAWFVGLSSLRLEQAAAQQATILGAMQKIWWLLQSQAQEHASKECVTHRVSFNGMCSHVPTLCRRKSVLEVACSFRMPTNITNPKSRKSRKDKVLSLEKVSCTLRSAVAMSESSREPLESRGSQRFRSNASPCPHPWCWYVYATNWMFFCGKCSAVNVKKHVNVTWMI